MAFVVNARVVYGFVGFWNCIFVSPFIVRRNNAVVQSWLILPCCSPWQPTTAISSFSSRSIYCPVLKSSLTETDIDPYQQNSTKSNPSDTTMENSIFNGDFAGWQALYDLDGKLIPIPTHYVPESLQEWGQVPPALEILVSEDDTSFIPTLLSAVTSLPTPTPQNAAKKQSTINQQDSSSTDLQVMLPSSAATVPLNLVDAIGASLSSSLIVIPQKIEQLWNRQTVTVLPETGCGIDNLDTIASTEAIDSTSSNWYYSHEPLKGVVMRSLLYEDRNRNGRNDHKIFVVDTTLARTNSTHRSRVGLRVLWPSKSSNGANIHHTESPQLLSPIKVAIERQISIKSSQGKLADGGGLDGRSMAHWLGNELRLGIIHSIFASSYPKRKSISRNYPDNECQSLTLPGNLTVTYTAASHDTGGSWLLETALLLPGSDFDGGVEHFVVQYLFNKSTELLSDREPIVRVFAQKELQQAPFPSHHKTEVGL